MPRPNFEEIIQTLEEYAQNLKDNAQIGNSKIVLADIEMIKVMGWASTQADTNNIQVANLTNEIKDLKKELKVYSTASDRSSKMLIWLTVALVILTIVIAVLTGYLIYDSKEQAASQNSIALNTQFFSPVNTRIIEDIENGQPILEKNKGKFSVAQLDNYLGTFDTIKSQYDKGLLTESDFCDSFSYYINITNANKEVRAYIDQQQKIDAGFFSSFLDLVDVVSQSHNVNCS